MRSPAQAVERCPDCLDRSDRLWLESLRNGQKCPPLERPASKRETRDESTFTFAREEAHSRSFFFEERHERRCLSAEMNSRHGTCNGDLLPTTKRCDAGKGCQISLVPTYALSLALNKCDACVIAAPARIAAATAAVSASIFSVAPSLRAARRCNSMQ